MSFALLVSIAVTFLAASSAPTPLYAVYEATWHFSPITLTVVFAVYAIAVLGALLTVGSLSDHIGRRPVLLAAILLQVAALSVFATASGVPALLVARIIQGFATGGALGAVGAGLLDLDKVKGTIVSGVGTVSGTAFGALVSGLMVQFWPAPTRLIYVALLGMFVLEEVGVALMGETSTKKVGAVASLRPHLAWPASSPSTVADRNPHSGGHLGPCWLICLTRTNHCAPPDRIGIRGAGRTLIVRTRSQRCSDRPPCEQGVESDGLVQLHCHADRRRRSHYSCRRHQVDHRLLLGNGSRRNRVRLRVPGCHAISAPPGETSRTSGGPVNHLPPQLPRLRAPSRCRRLCRCSRCGGSTYGQGRTGRSSSPWP